MPETTVAEYQADVRCGDHGTIVTVQGDIDLCSADRLAHTLEHLPCPQRRRILVDVAAVRYLDSTGITALRNAYRAVAGRLRVVGCPRRLRRIFNLLHVGYLLAAATPWK